MSGRGGVVRYLCDPAPGFWLNAGPEDPILSAIIEVPRFVEETWPLLREHPYETKREVFIRLGREVRRGTIENLRHPDNGGEDE